MKSGNKNSQNVQSTSISTILSLNPLKNLSPESFDLMKIEDTEEHPYFFGMGLPSWFNCNQGFKVEDSLIMQDLEEELQKVMVKK